MPWLGVHLNRTGAFAPPPHLSPSLVEFLGPLPEPQVAELWRVKSCVFARHYSTRSKYFSLSGMAGAQGHDCCLVQAGKAGGFGEGQHRRGSWVRCADGQCSAESVSESLMQIKHLRAGAKNPPLLAGASDEGITTVRRRRDPGCSPDAVRARDRARPCPRAHGAYAR
jgi:hypothetical protein